MKRIMLLAPENICDTLQDALSGKHIILPCSDPDTAKETLLSKPDILILSLSLSGMNSLDFLKEHAAIQPPVVIALTTFFDNEILDKLADFGVSSVIRIPFSLSYLENQL